MREHEPARFPPAIRPRASGAACAILAHDAMALDAMALETMALETIAIDTSSSQWSRRLRLVTTLLMAIMMLACTKPQPATVSPTSATQPSGGPRIIFPDNYAVRVEIAADEETRQQGLMYRDRLPEATGMIFIFAQPNEYPFWMKNTLIPLDMVWIDASHKIAHVTSDIPPCKADPCPSYPPNAIASYVLEVPAGVAAQHHLAAGQLLRFEGLDHVVVR